MKTIISLYFIVMMVGSAIAQPTVCPCTPATLLAHQERSGAKHDSNYSQYIHKKDTMTVNYIYAWQQKYTAQTNQIKTDPNNAASKRKHGTPEDTLYTLKGYMWFIKQEDDCDFHIEIGPKDAAGTRIVVEVAPENKALQNKIKQELDSRHLHIKGCTASSSTDTHFKQGIPVVVTGLGFYDASHKPNTNHGDAHTKLYSWELHPVKDVVFGK